MTTFTPGYSYTSSDWIGSGWQLVLPPQALFVNMLVTTATVRDLDGGLDVLDEHEDAGGRGALLRDGLDQPLVWSEEFDPSLLEDPADAVEFAAADEAHRLRFAQILTDSGRPMPVTVRDLAHLMAELGMFERTVSAVGERWRTPSTLPHPAQVLTLPAELTERLARIHRHHVTQPAAQAIIAHVCDDLGGPAQISVTLDRLAVITGHTVEEVRGGLQTLLDEGDFQVLRRGSAADPAELAGHARFDLTVDWDKFASGRISIQHGDGGGGQEIPGARRPS